MTILESMLERSFLNVRIVRYISYAIRLLKKDGRKRRILSSFVDSTLWRLPAPQGVFLSVPRPSGSVAGGDRRSLAACGAFAVSGFFLARALFP